MVVGSTCSLVWERRTTCWVTMRVPDPNIPIVRRPLPVREGRDLDHHVTACSEGAGVRGHAGGGGCAGPAFGPISFGGAAKGLLPCFLVPKGDQPTACTLALWWLKFGPTRGSGGGYAGTCGGSGGECRNFWGLRGGYAGTFGGLGGGMPELLGAQGGVCRNFRGLRGGYAGTFGGSGGDMPEPLGA